MAIKYFLATGPFGPVLLLAPRLLLILRTLLPRLRLALVWLFRSREPGVESFHTTPDNQRVLCATIAAITGYNQSDILRYRDELLADADFQRFCHEAMRARYRQALLDPEYRWGHRLAHYLLIRATKPGFVVEAGVRHGLGAAMILRALERNAAEGQPGEYLGIENNRQRDAFLWRLYPGDRGELVYGDSEQVLAQSARKIDLFLHETTTDPGHVSRQLAALQHRLAPDSIIVTPWLLLPLLDFAASRGLAVAMHHHAPLNHWVQGNNMMFLFDPKAARQAQATAA